MIRSVKFQYHLFCQQNSEISGDNEFTSSAYLKVAKHVYNVVHCHKDEPLQSQKRSSELIRSVKFQYHLFCQQNSEISGDNEFTSSAYLKVAKHVFNVVHCHKEEPLQSQKRSSELIRSVKFQYHLFCQQNSEISGDNEFTSSAYLKVAKHVFNVVHCHKDEPLQCQKRSSELIRSVKFQYHLFCQ